MNLRTHFAFLTVALLALPLGAQEEAPLPPKKADAAEAAADSAAPGRVRVRPIHNRENAPNQAAAAKVPANPAPTEPVIVQLEVAIISVPKADSLAVAEQFKNPATAEEAYRALAAKVKAGEADLVGYPVMETRSGNRAVIENINEVRYAIQYHPAPQQAAPAAPANNPDAPAAQPATSPVAILPTAFETRNTGVTLEAEPVLSSDGKTIDVQFAVQHVQFLGWEVAEVDDDTGAVPRVPQPSFRTNKLSTNMSVQDGQRALAGVFVSATDADTMEFFILTARKKTLSAK